MSIESCCFTAFFKILYWAYTCNSVKYLNPEIQQEGFVQFLLVKPQWRFYVNNIVIVVAMEMEV